MFDVKSLVGSGGNQSSSQKDSPLAAGSLTSIDNAKKAVGRPPGRPLVQKKPANMKRELYNILITQQEGRDIQSMMPTTTHDMYRTSKANMGKRRVRKYRWVPFTNEARKDGLKLNHWQRVDSIDNEEPYIFAKWNKVVNIPEYNDAEYKEHLQCAKWTREETDLLFEICRRFDLRWPVVHDRYETERDRVPKDKKPYDKRSIEDLKERFYTVIGELNQLRNPGSEYFAYDAEHERRRKEQLRKQFEKSQEEIEEEERLQEELKKIEARRKERERKAADLQKLINMEQHSPSVSGAHSPAPGKKMKMKNKLGTVPAVGGPITPAISTEIPTASTLRFSEFRSSGSHLRSQEMKLPTNIGQKKLKNIETVLEKMKLEVNPMGSDEVVRAYNEFRSGVVFLQELKQALQTAEYDLETVRTGMQQKGLETFDLEPRMRISAVPDGGYDPSSLDGGEGTPSSFRRITSWLDVSQPAGVLPTRKRKLPTAVAPSPMELKRPRKS